MRILASLCNFNCLQIFVKVKFAVVKFKSKTSQLSIIKWKGIMNRSSIKMPFLKISKYSHNSNCVGVCFYIKVQAFSTETLLKRLQHRCFPMNIAKFLRATILKNICEWPFEHFATWGNNIASNRKWRRHFLSARWKKLAFIWCSWSFRFSLFLHCMPQAAFALHNKRW